MRTIRLHNIDPGRGQLSLSLQLWDPKRTPTLRRGGAKHPILIPPGRYYDLVKELNVSFEEAERLRKSPEVLLHEQSGRLLVREHPPPPETLAREAAEAVKLEAARAKMAELNPPDPPDAVNAGVDLERAGLPADTPKRTGAPVVVPPVPLAAASAETTDDIPADAGADASTDAGAEVEAEAVVVEEFEPSMEWPEDDLRDFAAARGIALGSRKSKTSILKRIRDALAESS